MNVTVVGPRVLIRPDKLPETAADGLLHIIYDRQQSTMTGTVVAIGDGAELVMGAVSAALESFIKFYRLDEPDGTILQLWQEQAGFQLDHTVEVGERVIFSPQAGQELYFERTVLICIQEDDILAVIE